MSDFNPGSGWREYSLNDMARDEENCLVLYGGGMRPDRVWYPEEPVPPLPTEPYTVIRVRWAEKIHRPDVLVLRGGTWDGLGWNWAESVEEVQARITGFEVLARPTVTDEAWATIRREAREEAERDVADHEERHGEKMKAIVRRETAKAVIDRVRIHLPDVSPDSSIMAAIAREFEVSE